MKKSALLFEFEFNRVTQNVGQFTVVRSDFLTFGHPFAEQQSVGVSAVAV